MLVNLLTWWSTCGPRSIGWEHSLHSILMSQETLFKICCYLNSINDLFPLLCSILFLNVVHPNLPKEGCLNLNERNCSKIKSNKFIEIRTIFFDQINRPFNCSFLLQTENVMCQFVITVFHVILEKIKVL